MGSGHETRSKNKYLLMVHLFANIELNSPTPEGVMGHQLEGEPFIVPIAIPMTAGPSALATLILMVRSNQEKMVEWFSALMIAWTLTAFLFLIAPFLYKILRRRGLDALEQLMGMLLAMMAVQMLINGVKVLIA